MTKRKYDLLVFIGRFSPLHIGHQAVIDRALELSNNVLILVGSAGRARCTRNPFTFQERKTIIEDNYPSPRVIVKPLYDKTYNDTAWVIQVQSLVNGTVLELMNPDGFGLHGLHDAKIGLIGSSKDHTGYYLKMFPQWASEAVDFVESPPLSATDIRKDLFNFQAQFSYAKLSTLTQIFVDNFTHTAAYTTLRKEFIQLREYKQRWGNGPFLTADALVQVGGHILLVTRSEFGAGQLALPGGFVNPNEKFKDAAIRELREETRLRVPEAVLRGSIVGDFVGDDPNRSERGRLITQAFHFRLENETRLPEVRGADDAAEADWYAIDQLREEEFFEDHFHITQKLLGV